jgi:hypothetical protein
LVFTFVTVLVWVATSLLISQKKTGIDKELLNLSKPLIPNINEEIISEIESKKSYAQQELSNFPIYVVVKSLDGREQKVTTLGQEAVFDNPQEVESEEAVQETTQPVNAVQNQF